MNRNRTEKQNRRTRTKQPEKAHQEIPASYLNKISKLKN